MPTTVYGDRENIVIDSINTHNVIPCTNAIITFTDGTIIHIERNRYSHLWFIHYKSIVKPRVMLMSVALILIERLTYFTQKQCLNQFKILKLAVKYS